MHGFLTTQCKIELILNSVFTFLCKSSKIQLLGHFFLYEKFHTLIIEIVRLSFFCHWMKINKIEMSPKLKQILIKLCGLGFYFTEGVSYVKEFVVTHKHF